MERTHTNRVADLLLASRRRCADRSRHVATFSSLALVKCRLSDVLRGGANLDGIGARLRDP